MRQAQELCAPPAWRILDFFSDLHLTGSAPQTLHTLRHYLQHTPADALFILGDLFEVWLGDDVLEDGTCFEAQCCAVLAQAAASGKALYVLHGNRDFLLGHRFAQASHATLLADLCTLTFAQQRWLLTHGDALCLDDVDYQHFRTLARSSAWQQQFLAQSLPARQAQARAIRAQSQARHGACTPYADIDPDAAGTWLQSAQASTLVHGHTHRPAQHHLHAGRVRYVLSDWDGSGPEVLRLTAATGLQRVPLAAGTAP